MKAGGREPSRASLCKDADDVVAGDNVIEAHLLARGELAALAVDEGILELVDEGAVDLVTDVFDRGALAHHQWIREVGTLAALLGVDAVHAELVPHDVLEIVDVEVGFDRDDDRVGLPGELVHLFHADRVDLVVDVEAGDVVAVAEHDIDEFVDGDVLPEHDVYVVHLVALEDGADHPLVDLGEREAHGLGDDDASGVLLAEDDVWLGLVEADADGLELLLEQRTVGVWLCGVEHDDDHVCGLGDGDDLATSTLALGSAFDDTGQIEDLDLGTLVLEHAWLTCERGELVGCGFGFRVGDLGEEARLSDRGEADQGDTCIARLHHVEALTGLSGLLLRLEQLMSELGDLGTQLTEMVPVREGVDQGNQYWIGRVGSSKRRVHLLCCLVLLGPCDLIFELLDLFDDTHIDGSGCAKQVVGMLLWERGPMRRKRRGEASSRCG
ncbi:hypothetical protein L1887_55605 [Cichorium endivia]|nr:hypothetical protein L1887_55605 [Cichorium endivia]